MKVTVALELYVHIKRQASMGHASNTGSVLEAIGNSASHLLNYTDIVPAAEQTLFLTKINPFQSVGFRIAAANFAIM